METKKYLGIWMDHSTAHLIDLNMIQNNHSITSAFTFSAKGEAMEKGEGHMHHKEQQMQEFYYKEIGEAILKYDNVLLFGPTDAKTELHNLLQKDSHFKDINIEVEGADKMTDNEKNAFVKNHFEGKAKS